MTKVRKVPMRQCLGCREMKPKKDLVRLVRSPEGELSLDRTGRKPGRGAYICNEPGCLEKAVAAKAVEKALGVSVTPDLEDALRKELISP